MAVIRIQDFSGVVPVKGDRAIPDVFGVESINTWLYGSELRGIRPPEELVAISGLTRKVFRIPKRTVGGDPTHPGVIPPPSYLPDSLWLQFEDIDTDIVRGQLVDDQYSRWYFCSPSLGIAFNTYDRMVGGGGGAWKLGVPPPSPVEAWAPTITDIQPGVPPVKKSGPIQEVEFSIADVGGNCSYSNPGGTGNRTATVIVVSSIGWSVDDSALVNGNTTELTLTMNNINQTGKYIRFDFGASATKIFNEITWYQADATDYGNWQMQVSVGGVDWLDVGAPFRLGGMTKQTIFRTVGSPGYRFLRLIQESEPAQLMVTRSYVYTYVNQYGEESQPSLPVTGAGAVDGVWSIGNIKDPAAAPGYPAYDHKNLYRTVTSASGVTDYYKVAEIAIGTLTYNDDTMTKTDAIIVSGLQLESTNYALPPANMQGIVAMPNGFLIGWIPGQSGRPGSTLCMSEPYRWHAWPPQYQQATEIPVVGLGVIGQTCVVCTQGYPAAISGVKPDTCAFTKATTGEPCLSRGSIVSTPDGVLYSSQNGLMLVGPGGIQNVTASMITREEWVKEYMPQFLRACRYQNGYLAVQAHAQAAIDNKAFYLDPSSLKVALTKLSSFEDVVNAMSDIWSGEVFIIDAGKLMRWDPPTPTPPTAMLPVQWKSKEFQYPFQENFGAYAVYWDQARYSDNTLDPEICPVGEEVRLRVYADRVLRYDQRVPRNGRPVRLPSGFKADVWQFEICARAPVYSLHVASTMRELKAA